MKSNWTAKDTKLLIMLVEKQMERFGYVDFGILAETLQKQRKSVCSKAVAMNLKYILRPTKESERMAAKVGNRDIWVLSGKQVNYRAGRHGV